MIQFKFKGGVWRNDFGTEKFLLFFPIPKKPAVSIYSMVKMGLVIPDNKDGYYKTLNNFIQLVSIRVIENRPAIHYFMVLKLSEKEPGGISIYPIDRESGFGLMTDHGRLCSIEEVEDMMPFPRSYLMDRMSIPSPLFERMVEIKKEWKKKIRL